MKKYILGLGLAVIISVAPASAIAQSTTIVELQNQIRILTERLQSLIAQQSGVSVMPSPTTPMGMPAASSAGNSQNSSGKFRVGEVVRADTNISVRSSPAVIDGIVQLAGGQYYGSSNKLGVQPSGAQGRVVDGPFYSSMQTDTYVWWKIDYDNGVDGYSAEDFLSRVEGGLNPITNTQARVDIKANGLDKITNFDPSTTLTISWTASPEIRACELTGVGVNTTNVNGPSTMSSGVSAQTGNVLTHQPGSAWYPRPLPGYTAVYGISCERYDARGSLIQGAAVRDTVEVTIASAVTPPVDERRPTIRSSATSVKSGEQFTLYLGKYPANASSWTLSHNCPSGFVISQKGGSSCSSGSQREEDVVTLTRNVSPNVNHEWPITITNNSGTSQTIVYWFNAFDANGRGLGGVTESVSVDPVSIPVPSTATLSASPSIITAGQTSVLMPNASGVLACSMSADTGEMMSFGGLGVPITVKPTRTTTYTLNCYKINTASDVVSARTTVTVQPVTTTPNAPMVTLSVSPNTITPGQSATVAWSSTNATSCRMKLSTGWDFAEPLSGSYSVSPTQDVTYTMTCANSAGLSSSDTASLKVTQTTPSIPPPTVIPPAGQPVVNFSASSLSVPAASALTLTLDARNVGYCLWPYAASGPYRVSTFPVSMTIYPTQTTTYHARCFDKADKEVATRNVTVTVQSVKPPFVPPTVPPGGEEEEINQFLEASAYQGLQALLLQLSRMLGN